MATTLGAVAAGGIVYLNENGSPVEFYVACQDYESGLNGAGRTLLVRKNCYKELAWATASAESNVYEGSLVDQFLVGDYFSLFDKDIQEAMAKTSFYYTPGGGNNTVSVLKRPIFVLSIREYGFSNMNSNTEGSALPIASTLRTAVCDGSTSAARQQTRSPSTANTTSTHYVTAEGTGSWSYSYLKSGVRPAFTLPANSIVDDSGNTTAPPPIVHKTLIGGVAHEILGGTVNIGGVKHSITKGRTLVGGVGRDITFAGAGTPISDLPEETIVYLNENGSPVEFYIAKHDYESGLNGAGRTLLVRKDCYDTRAWHSTNVNAYATSDIDSWLNGTWLKLLDADIQEAAGTTTFYYTPGNGTTTVTTLSRAAFILSLTELGKTKTGANTEGSALPIASTLELAYISGSIVFQWTRTPRTSDNVRVFGLGTEGGNYGLATYTYGSRPCITLPADRISVDGDGFIIAG